MGLLPYRRMPLQGDFDELRFPLIERWRGYVVGTDSLGPRVRMWRMFLNGVDHVGVNWTPYVDSNLEATVPQMFMYFELNSIARNNHCENS
ncbi:hypothetical protein PIB30_052392 [Stylosanthes scabra]|uniref:Uncharacterized protein n=1 Tax=Stylosanthes scabra TaxID=79078 RepID=A0ABU6XFX4_9FABA|nr:hypothetical protein [Stylosanthes scabra]